MWTNPKTFYIQQHQSYLIVTQSLVCVFSCLTAQPENASFFLTKWTSEKWASAMNPQSPSTHSLSGRRSSYLHSLFVAQNSGRLTLHSPHTSTRSRILKQYIHFNSRVINILQHQTVLLHSTQHMIWHTHTHTHITLKKETLYKHYGMRALRHHLYFKYIYI